MSTRAITPERRSIPPLESGDHLTRNEFERRYEAMPSATKAELIEGVVYMAPPAVRWDYHATPHSYLTTWLGTYALATPGLQLGDNGSVRLDLNNEPQPDAALIIQPAYGGQARFATDGFLEGAPELAAEVSGTTASLDLNAKLRAYCRNGVREYIVWRVRDREIDWFAMRHGKYEPLLAADGIIRSEVFPGLWLDPKALVTNPAAAMRVLHQGISSPEHADFVRRLNASGAAAF